MFSDEELNEFLLTNKIERLEQINDFKLLKIESIKLYIDFTQNLNEQELELFLYLK